MNAHITRTFKSGNSEAVRLPKGFGFGIDVELEVTRKGGVVTLRPKPKLTNRELADALRAIGQPADGVQPREPFEDLERPGL